jgi:hypothetical protein
MCLYLTGGGVPNLQYHSIHLLGLYLLFSVLFTDTITDPIIPMYFDYQDEKDYICLLFSFFRNTHIADFSYHYGCVISDLLYVDLCENPFEVHKFQLGQSMISSGICIQSLLYDSIICERIIAFWYKKIIVKISHFVTTHTVGLTQDFLLIFSLRLMAFQHLPLMESA